MRPVLSSRRLERDLNERMMQGITLVIQGVFKLLDVAKQIALLASIAMSARHVVVSAAVRLRLKEVDNLIHSLTLYWPGARINALSHAYHSFPFDPESSVTFDQLLGLCSCETENSLPLLPDK
jgi:hypothetical protein